MVLEQLYFTSCERGHGPVAGYQFNALSPGADAGIQREVQSLVGYRPPRSQAFPAGLDELRQCPVNLCFRPGSPAVLTNVEYVGQDFSGGFGNFFAHAFAADSTADLAAGLGERLPIEMWRSPVWVRSQSADLVLPRHPGPLPRGGVTPATVEAFLAEHPLADRLPLLVTAVAAAQAGWGPPVLLIESDSDRVALWIGAVSYLLPPRAAATLAFATYTAEPATLASLHVVGTVSEAAAELPLDLVHAFELFDMPAGHVPEGRPLAVAAVAARVGVGAARSLWQTAETLAEAETPFDAWYGPLSAAAALNGIQLALPEDRAVAEWVARSIERWEPSVANDLALKLNQQPQWRAPEYLPVLFKLAWRGRNQALCDEIRIRQIDIELARVRDGAPGASAAARIESPRVRFRVAARVRELLESAPVGSAPGVLRLLDWARRTGLAPELETDFLIDLTKWVLVPEAMSGRWTDDDADPLRAALRSWPAVRQGFVTYLLELAGSAERLDAALDGPLGAFLRGTASFEVEVAEYPELQEAFWISRARQDPTQQPTVLHAVLHQRSTRLPDAELLGRIWPHGWSAQEMAHVATATPLEDLDDDAVAAWFLDTLATASTPEDISWYVTVGRRLLASPSARRLQPRCAPLAKAVELDRRCRDVRDFKDLEWIARQDSTATSMIAVMVATCLPELLLTSMLDPDQVCSVLELMYPDAMRAFLQKVQTPPLDRSVAGLMRLAGVYVLAETRYHHDSVLRAELLGCFDQAVAEMNDEEWEELRRLVLSSKRQVEDEFLMFEESRQPTRSWFPFGIRKRG